jgi:hypothetical protein
MGKLLFWFIVILAVLLVARLLSHSAANKKETKAPPKRPPANKPDMTSAEAMVRCEHCGIHMPRSEAYLSNGHTWCGPEHARLGQRKS